MTDTLSRRRFLSRAAGLTVAGAAGLSTWQSQAWAATPAAPAATAALNPLTPDDPRVPALGYVADAAKAKADSMYKPGSTCANCSQLKGKVGDKLRPCALFPDLKNPKQLLLVTSTGWCRSWTAMPKAT
ncbi:MAG: high-potential iron-sulfur protein [Gammaproteobacteria bacterium]